MAYLFEEIMSFHPDNRDVYQEIKMNLSNLVPFIGAGLTQFVYDTWPGTLKKIANKITNRKNYRKVKTFINSQDYLNAAQLLEELRSPENLARDLANFFAIDKLNDKQQELKKEAVSLLPMLFSGLVLTTNYDQILETVYDNYGCSFQINAHPGHSELLEQYIRNEIDCGLYKFHGTISGGHIEYDKIVFTRKQYENHYAPNSPLEEDLKNCLAKKSMLFLGCSLNDDYIMKLLEEIVRPGDYHYTIINCKKSERDDKIKQLGEKHIRAIVYENNRHEAVRVILEHLLEETKPDIYQHLPYHGGALKSFDLSNRFSYKAGIVSIVGRKAQMEELNDFLNSSDRPFCWWAITGPGGSGKSRLAYEFQKQLPLEWNVHYLTTSDYENFFTLSNYFSRKTLVIADYVQEYARELGRWMEQISEQYHSSQLRVLLIERDSDEALGGTAWIEQLYSNVRNKVRLEKKCYRNNFMKLPTLLDKDLLYIIESYATIMYQEGMPVGSLTNQKKRMLLQKLKMIDPQLHRPLYAMFLTDAYMADKKPEQWDREEVLQYVVQRELDRLKSNVKNITNSEIFDRKLYAVCQDLLNTATVLQDPPFYILRQIRSDIWKIIEQKSDYFLNPEDMLNQLELANKDKILSMRPDLMGEYLVYDWLKQRSKQELRNFLTAVWRIPRFTVAFFNRLFSDYCYLLDENPQMWDFLLPEDILLKEDVALLYAQLRLNVTSYCKVDTVCQKQVSILGKFAAAYPDNLEMVSLYYKSFVNIVLMQDVQEAEKTVEYLTEKIAGHFDDPEIVLAFAYSLSNLITKQEIHKAQKTLKQLEELVVMYSDNSRILIIFCEVLENLNYRLNLRMAQQNIIYLEKTVSTYPDIPQIAIAFANGLCDLSLRQEMPDAIKTAEKLNEFAVSKSDVSEVSTICARTWFTLINPIDENTNILSRLKKLVVDNQESSEILVYYAKGLVNFGSKNEKNARKSSMELRRLVVEHSDVSEIIIFYADSLVNLTNKLNEEEAIETVKELHRLLIDYFKIPEIAVSYASGLFNLSKLMDEKKGKKVVKILENLEVEYYMEPKVAIILVKTLHCLGVKQSKQDAQKTFQKIEAIANNYSDIQEMVVEYANSLVNFGIIIDANKCVNRLKQLVAIHPDIKEVKNDYITATANYYFTLGSNQKTKEKMEELFVSHSEMKNITVLFAKSLFNLLREQKGSEAVKTAKKLEELVDGQPDVPELRIEFAEGLSVLIPRQDKEEVYETIRQLEQLTKDYPDMPELVVAYANGMLNLGYVLKNYFEIIQQMEKLVQTYPNIPELISIYAKCMANHMCYNQSEKEAYNIVTCIEKFVVEDNTNSELLSALSLAYYHLSNMQKKEDAAVTVSKAEKLSRLHPNIPELSTYYAQSLVNLCIKQADPNTSNMVTEASAQNILKKLTEYASYYIEIPEIHKILTQTIDKITESLKK